MNKTENGSGVEYRLARLEEANRSRYAELAEIAACIRTMTGELRESKRAVGSAIGDLADHVKEVRDNVALMLEWFQEFKRRKSRKKR